MDSYRSIWAGIAAIAVFIGAFVLENLAPLRPRRSRLSARIAVNLAASVFVYATAASTVRPAVTAAMGWSASRSFGLIWFLPEAVRFVAAFLLLDLAFYYWHIAVHKVGVLWRFHNVHHMDPDLDVSTGFRFHFGEVLASVAFRVVQVSVIGPEAWMFFAYEAVFQAGTLFHHSNLRLPIRVERVLSLVLVTPRMHGIHHSQVREEADSNFSVVLSLWDRLHGTLALNVRQSAITVGVPAYSTSADNRFWSILALPFRKQRDYWRRADGERVVRERSALEGRKGRLAE